MRGARFVATRADRRGRLAGVQTERVMENLREVLAAIDCIAVTPRNR